MTDELTIFAMNAINTIFQMLEIGQLKKMSYATDLITTIRDSNKWPSFDRPDFLEELDNIANEAMLKKSIEGYLASLLIFHQLCEELVRLLLKDAQFFIQLSVFPAEINFTEKKKLMFGQLIDELKNTLSFESKIEFIEKCNALNTHRIDIVILPCFHGHSTKRLFGLQTFRG